MLKSKFLLNASFNPKKLAPIKAGIDKEIISDVECPIGLNIGAESPQEIAVAVLAQIIADVKGVEPASATWRE